MATKLCHLLRYCTCCFWITKCLTYIPIWFPCKFSYSWTSTHRQAYKMQSSYLPSEPMARCTRPSCLQIWQKPITSTWRYSRKVLLCQWMCLNSQPGWLGGVLSAYRRKGPWPCHCPWQLEPCALWWWLCSQRILSWWTPPPPLQDGVGQSVPESMDAVASSRTSILFLRRRTRARQKSCRWPPLQFLPSSLTQNVRMISIQGALSVMQFWQNCTPSI